MHDPAWLTRDGRMMKISEMETSHIVNCIAKIQRSGGRWRGEYLPRLELELEIRSLQRRSA